MLVSLIIIGIMLGLFLLYSLIPTFLYRLLDIGMIQRGKKKKSVAITFDDGPHSFYTPQILDLFKENNAKTTFFVVGENAEANPELLIRMKKEGHAIGIHHYRHTSNWLLTPSQSRIQCQKTADVIESITGERPVYYRPPWGHLNAFVHWSAHPFVIVMWSAILGDWKVKLGKDRLLKRLKKHSTDGAIIVLHDRGDNPGADKEAPAMTIETLKVFFDAQNGDKSFVSLPQLLNKD